jgi:hypothetical protein
MYNVQKCSFPIGLKRLFLVRKMLEVFFVRLALDLRVKPLRDLGSFGRRQSAESMAQRKACGRGCQMVSF